MPDVFAGVDPEFVLTAEAQLGFSAEDFWDSQLGQYIRGACEQDADEATDVLKNIDLTRETERAQAAQFRLRLAEAVPDYINGLIRQGKEAEEQLKMLEHQADMEQEY